MSASSGAWAHALQAAQAVAAGQSYPPGTLYMLATPIGNLADISLRALHVLHMVDAIACEDTRHTAQMLRAYGISTAAARLLALHRHNECEAAQLVLERLKQGQRIAFVSDAGTPAISDPGAALVQHVRAAGLRVLALPGPSSVMAALSVAGADLQGGWVFHGFMHSKTSERALSLQAFNNERRAIVLFEAPHRIGTLAQELAQTLAERSVTVAREISKQFEETVILPAHALPQWLKADTQRSRGEFVIVVHAAAQAPTTGLPAQALHTLHLLLAELPLKSAVRLACEIHGVARNRLYEAALQWKSSASSLLS